MNIHRKRDRNTLFVVLYQISLFRTRPSSFLTDDCVVEERILEAPMSRWIDSGSFHGC